MNSTNTQELLTRGVEDILPSRKGLEELLAKKKIRLYLGIDPTGNKLHLGHAVVLRKLQQFAAAGHEVILLVGNGTVKIGDPTGRDKTRPMLTDQEIEDNFQTWKEQAGKILDFSLIQLKHNGDWLDKLTFVDMVKLMARSTVQQLLERDMFQERLKGKLPIFTHELMYPLLQGYDSVAMDVDLELGGNDQLFNMMVGRQLQQDINGRDKYVLTVPLLQGSDGRKMGKSFNNFISLTETPNDMYGKLMSVVDEVIFQYFRLLTDVASEEIEKMEVAVNSGELHPMEAKKRLALEITTIYHDSTAAQAAAVHFQSTVQEKSVPEDVIELSVNSDETVLGAVMATQVPASKTAARALISQGGVSVDGEKVSDPESVLQWKAGQILRVGKRAYFKIEIA
jgi:tyrosyl-tRNA synthetase